MSERRDAAPSSTELRLDEERLDDGRLLVSAHGALDLFAAPELKRRLLDAVGSGANDLIVDLSETQFVDSTCLGAVLTAHRRMSGKGGRVIVVVGPGVARVLEITGLDSILTTTATRESAVSQSSGAAVAAPPSATAADGDGA